MNCQSVKKVIDPFLDLELSTAEREGVEAHTRLCAGCAALLERARRERRTLGLLLESEPLPAAKLSEMEQRLKAAVDAEMAPARRLPWIDWVSTGYRFAAVAIVLGLMLAMHTLPVPIQTGVPPAASGAAALNGVLVQVASVCAGVLSVLSGSVIRQFISSKISRRILLCL